MLGVMWRPPAPSVWAQAQRRDANSQKKQIVELSDEDLQQLGGPGEGIGQRRAQLTVPEEHHRSTITALGMDALHAQIRQVFFFDTPGPGAQLAGRGGPGRGPGRAATTPW